MVRLNSIAAPGAGGYGGITPCHPVLAAPNADGQTVPRRFAAQLARLNDPEFGPDAVAFDPAVHGESSLQSIGGGACLYYGRPAFALGGPGATRAGCERNVFRAGPGLRRSAVLKTPEGWVALWFDPHGDPVAGPWSRFRWVYPERAGVAA